MERTGSHPQYYWIRRPQGGDGDRGLADNGARYAEPVDPLAQGRGEDAACLECPAGFRDRVRWRGTLAGRPDRHGPQLRLDASGQLDWVKLNELRAARDLRPIRITE